MKAYCNPTTLPWFNACDVVTDPDELHFEYERGQQRFPAKSCLPSHGERQSDNPLLRQVPPHQWVCRRVSSPPTALEEQHSVVRFVYKPPQWALLLIQRLR